MKRYCFVILPLVLLALLAPGGGAALAEELPCLQCHPSKNTGKVVHQAVGMGCSLCHLNPHAKEKPELSLTSDMPGLCYQCHDKSGFEKASVHMPVAGGMCGSCHDAHASDYAKLLSGSMPGICYGCHDRAAFTRAVQHGPVARGECTSCHNPHSSDFASGLVSPPGELCQMCHYDKTSGAHVLSGLGFGDRHPLSGKPDPSRKGQELSCRSCHMSHSTDSRALFPLDGKNFDNLCLLCHEKSYIRF